MLFNKEEQNQPFNSILGRYLENTASKMDIPPIIQNSDTFGALGNDSLNLQGLAVSLHSYATMFEQLYLYYNIGNILRKDRGFLLPNNSLIQNDTPDVMAFIDSYIDRIESSVTLYKGKILKGTELSVLVDYAAHMRVIAKEIQASCDKYCYFPPKTNDNVQTVKEEEPAQVAV